MPREPHSGGALGDWGRGPDSGGAAFVAEMDRQVRDLIEHGELVPPRGASPDSRRQLAYLNGLKGGAREPLLAAGVPYSTVRRWERQGFDVHPIGANTDRVARAYWGTRARNWRRTGRPVPPAVRQALAPQLKERAHGQRMTVRPVDYRDVHPQARGAQKVFTDKGERTVRPSNARWDHLVDAYAGGDETQMDDAWMIYAGDIDSPPEGYYEVASVGFMI
ncbi:hypothetical protein [Streptomyces beihaiensis]|uniref:Transcriptional regulator n=1 Tax=Streptomyces beihaiensis TaxID=2984495 RepID=A0ABT3TWE7_9ACTN|nr:hypothetical protein [Streptomyces beihaiensis]MCX3061373.1 hypothetical protein [Streptomyces beihaiensis]